MRIEQSFIPVYGVGETTERRLWEAGITDWAEFDGSVVGPTTADRIEAFLDEATRRLADRDADFFDDRFPSGEGWRLYENFRDDACFFDIETTGLDREYGRVTTVSVHRSGETTTLVRGDTLSRDAVRDLLGDAPLLVSFNGKRFDVPFLESAFDLTLDRPHLDLLYPCRRLDLAGGLKRVERAVGIDRDRPDLSGRDAVRLWRDHERGRAGAIDRLISYNREDAENLLALADHVTDRLHRATVPPAGPAAPGRF